VIIQDGHTVVIGGLIDETMNETIFEVPCLGNVPGLGWLFKSLSRTSGKTNLFIFLTPHIIENPEEADGVYQEKKNEIDTVQEGVIKMYQDPLDRPSESEEKLTH
jgi:general secretion pathway protein D